MSITLTVMIPTADQPRLEEALAASGIDPASMIVQRLNDIVSNYESGLVSTEAWGEYQAAMAAQQAAYVPLAPEVTVTPGP